MSTVTTETATVYRGAGRRWFTRRAAYRAVARAVVNERCRETGDCDGGEADALAGYVPPGCRWHRDPDHAERLLTRLARRYERRDRAALGGG